MSRRSRDHRLERGRARPHRRGLRLAATARRRDADHPGPAHRRRHRRLCPGQQLHPDHHRQVDAARAGSSMLHGSVVHELIRQRRRRSASMSSRATTSASAPAASRSRRPQAQRGFELAALSRQRRLRRRRRSAVGLVLQQFLGVSQPLAGLPDRGAGERHRAMGCGRRSFACLVSVLAYNFFFLPPLYTFTIADPENVVALFFFVVVAVIASNLTARMRGQAIAARSARQDDRRALRCSAASSPASVDARRSAVGDRVSDRLDAEGARRHAAARGRRRHRGARRLPARGHARRGRSRGGANGAGSTTSRPGAAPTRCPAPSGCSCRCAPAAARSASSASTATRRARC